MIKTFNALSNLMHKDSLVEKKILNYFYYYKYIIKCVSSSKDLNFLIDSHFFFDRIKFLPKSYLKSKKNLRGYSINAKNYKFSYTYKKSCNFILPSLPKSNYYSLLYFKNTFLKLLKNSRLKSEKKAKSVSKNNKIFRITKLLNKFNFNKKEFYLTILKKFKISRLVQLLKVSKRLRLKKVTGKIKILPLKRITNNVTNNKKKVKFVVKKVKGLKYLTHNNSKRNSYNTDKQIKSNTFILIYSPVKGGYKVCSYTGIRGFLPGSHFKKIISKFPSELKFFVFSTLFKKRYSLLWLISKLSKNFVIRNFSKRYKNTKFKKRIKKILSLNLVFLYSHSPLNKKYKNYNINKKTLKGLN